MVGSWFTDCRGWSPPCGLRMDSSSPPSWERPGLWTPTDQPLTPWAPWQPRASHLASLKIGVRVPAHGVLRSHESTEHGASTEQTVHSFPLLFFLFLLGFLPSLSLFLSVFISSLTIPFFFLLPSLSPKSLLSLQCWPSQGKDLSPATSVGAHGLSELLWS